MISGRARPTLAIRQPPDTSQRRARVRGALIIQEDGIFTCTAQFPSATSSLPE